MQCDVRERMIRKQKIVEEGVQYFRCWRMGHYKWEYPNTKEEKERRSEKAAHAASLQKVQQKE